MKIINICLILFFSFSLFLIPGHAQEEVSKDEVSEAETQEPVRTALTKEELLERIIDVLDNREDVRGEIPGIALVDDGFAVHYEFNGVKLENLDEQLLQNLLNAINQKIMEKNLEQIQRIQRQMRDMQTIQNIQRTQRLLRQQQAPKVPTPPKVQTPPKIPQPPRR